ncbi:hypothetical protein ACFL1L_01540 [Thermoplasmatota archaeon]
MEKILENVTIYFKNGERECYCAISFRKKGICTGFITNDTDNNLKFIEQGYIPLDQIDKITYSTEDDELKIFNLLENNREEK